MSNAKIAPRPRARKSTSTTPTPLAPQAPAAELPPSAAPFDARELADKQLRPLLDTYGTKQLSAVLLQLYAAGETAGNKPIRVGGTGIEPATNGL